ncbi:hypothetical protein ACRALDRAFT_1070352 [Sodiomyces alcalophilus JCM 7366]|uniref:uncharacterized protein n=1 Tax=Sodiomyces alcalophilus JCM 7366 TaxID=591952 RepID=UPI0039B5F0B2
MQGHDRDVNSPPSRGPIVYQAATMTSHHPMYYDADWQMQEIDLSPQQGTRGRILHHVEKAQELMVPVAASRDWCEHLRFVVRAPESGPGPDHAFELIESANEQEAREPFIAISYRLPTRWPSSEAEVAKLPRGRILAPEPGKPPSEKHWRQTRAPLDLLERAFAFADAKGIRKIWIDQECIHQDSDHDRRLAVQSMHLVYR